MRFSLFVCLLLTAFACSTKEKDCVRARETINIFSGRDKILRKQIDKIEDDRGAVADTMTRMGKNAVDAAVALAELHIKDEPLQQAVWKYREHLMDFQKIGLAMSSAVRMNKYSDFEEAYQNYLEWRVDWNRFIHRLNRYCGFR